MARPGCGCAGRPGLPRARRRVRWPGCGGWPPIQPSRPRWPAGRLSASWARELCGWSDRLPASVREDADRLLCQAATDGADLADLGRLAEAIRQRTCGPDRDGEDGFGERNFHLGITFSGAGRAQGDLRPGARPRWARCWTR